MKVQEAMKQTIQFVVAIAVSAAAMFVYMYEPRPERVVQEVGQAAPSPTHQYAPSVGSHASSNQPAETPKRELTAAELADIDPASIDWAGVKKRFAQNMGIADSPRVYDPMLIRLASYGDYTEREIAAFNKLHVIEFNPKVGESCERVLSGIEGVGDEDGITEHCTPVLKYPPHPLASASLEKLQELSQTDAAAAVFASRKSSDDNEAIGLAVRAVLLSGKPGPLTEVIERRFSDVFLPDDATYEEHLEKVGEAMLLDRLASKLGDPRIDLKRFDPWLEKQFDSDSDKQGFLNYIERAASAEVKNLGEIQRDLTGATSILELTNA
jgi:hypothetical protein